MLCTVLQKEIQPCSPVSAYVAMADLCCHDVNFGYRNLGSTGLFGDHVSVSLEVLFKSKDLKTALFAEYLIVINLTN